MVMRPCWVVHAGLRCWLIFPPSLAGLSVDCAIAVSTAVASVVRLEFVLFHLDLLACGEHGCKVRGGMSRKAMRVLVFCDGIAWSAERRVAAEFGATAPTACWWMEEEFRQQPRRMLG